MLLLLRRLKHDLFMNDSFSKYSSYAFGELLLVVFGILIALQINNWNEDRKERAALQSYLESIARNMREDLTELEPLREHRLETLHAAVTFGTSLRNRNRFEVDEIFFLNHMMQLSTTEAFFSANTSGFEALKSSGVLARLQGSGVENLLSSYYDKVNQVSLLESNLYGKVRLISIELNRVRPREMEILALYNPSALPLGRFQELQPAYSQVVNDVMMSALSESQAANHQLMLYYDSLKVLGRAFSRAVEAGQLDIDEGIPRVPIEDWNEQLGLPNIVTAGRPALEAYWLTAITPPDTQVFRFDSIQFKSDELHINYPGGAGWASIYWEAIKIRSGRSHMDFTAFTKLQLQLKGDQGGEVVKVHVKDADYPDDRDPISVDLTLTDDWQIYDIDLAEFAPTDFGRLNVVLGFLIYPGENALAFSVRNAFYH